MVMWMWARQRALVQVVLQGPGLGLGPELGLEQEPRALAALWWSGAWAPWGLGKLRDFVSLAWLPP